jgi:hypothetical protein
MADEVKIYDIATDDRRAVTQADIDRLTAVAAAYSLLCGDVETRKAELHRQLKVIAERGR